MSNIDNINVTAFDAMPTPEEILQRLPLSASAEKTITEGREILRNILERKDHRQNDNLGCPLTDDGRNGHYAASPVAPCEAMAFRIWSVEISSPVSSLTILRSLSTMMREE